MVRKTIKKSTTQDATPARRKIEVADPPASALIAGAPSEPEESGKIVTVKIPRDFRLTLDSHHEVHYKAGIDEMPLEHALHWFAQANGVEVYRGRD